MSVRVLLISALLLGFLCAPVIAQDAGVADTVYMGSNGQAWLYPGNLICLPVYVASDAELVGVQIGIEYAGDGYDLSFDSASSFGTVFMNNSYMSLTGGLVSSQFEADGIAPDSVILAAVGFGNGDQLPPGRYLFGKAWFTAAGTGSSLTVDSAWVPPSGNFLLMPKNGNPYTPEYVGGALTPVAGPAEIYVIDPGLVEGDAASLLTLSIAVAAGYAPATIVLDSVVNSMSGEALSYLPATTGANPLEVEWTPTYEEFGFFDFWFTATDAESNTLAFSQNVKVNWVQPPCEVFRGDANCDDIVNITDVVYLLQYMFQQGPPPGCEGP